MSVTKLKQSVVPSFLGGNSSVSISYNSRIFVVGVYNPSSGFALVARDGNVFFLNENSDISATASGGVLTLSCSANRGYRLICFPA